MTDIVDRLRMDYFEFKGHALLREAADEIERLRSVPMTEAINGIRLRALEEAAQLAWEIDDDVGSTIADAIIALKDKTND